METMKPLIDRLEKNLEKINVAHRQLSNEASYLSLSRKFIEDLIHVILNNGAYQR